MAKPRNDEPEVEVEPTPAPAAAPTVDADAFKTEQEKGPPDPVGEAIEPVKAEIMKGAKSEPYPQGKKE